jgi:hypothetical protein
MLTDVTLAGHDGTVTEFALVGYTPDGSRRIAENSSLSEPHMLEIKHSTSGGNGSQIDRHLISLARTRLNTAGVPRKAVVNLTLSVPRDTIITKTDIYNLVSQVVSFMVGGGWTYESGFPDKEKVDQMLRGES